MDQNIASATIHRRLAAGILGLVGLVVTTASLVVKIEVVGRDLAHEWNYARQRITESKTEDCIEGGSSSALPGYSHILRRRGEDVEVIIKDDSSVLVIVPQANLRSLQPRSPVAPTSHENDNFPAMLFSIPLVQPQQGPIRVDVHESWGRDSAWFYGEVVSAWQLAPYVRNFMDDRIASCISKNLKLHFG